jgi:hypothetical protein
MKTVGIGSVQRIAGQASASRIRAHGAEGRGKVDHPTLTRSLLPLKSGAFVRHVRDRSPE